MIVSLALDAATGLQDLSPLRSVGLHKLKGERNKPWAMTVNGRWRIASIAADTAVRLGRYINNSAQFWLNLQSQYDIAIVERDNGGDITRRVRPADAA